MAIIGIDLGTTNSLGAVYKNNHVELIPNRFGSFLTPSVVSITEDGTVQVGEIAKERLVTHAACTAASFKKDMGTERKIVLKGKAFTPEELSSFIIRSIVEDAKEYLGEEIEEVVISVPAYFHDKQRVATKRAGALAGVMVNRIINEPSAAAMASYLDTNKEQLFLVFDFGGGTLDVSVVECFDTMIEIVSVAGDNRLGGDDFHEIMIKGFLRENKLEKKDLTSKEYAILLKQAEKCKCKLTEEADATMNLIKEDAVYQSVYNNERILEESGSLFGRIKEVIAHALRDGDLRVDDIDAVIMVGGSSKMPLVQSYLKHIFRDTPLVVGNCDEMIARGLGLVCAVKERKEDIKDYVMTDICPFTLGTDVRNDADPENSYMEPIIERNTVLPCSRVKRFCTAYDNQKKVGLGIYQGEHVYAKDNLKLGKIEVAVPEGKAGQEKIDVRFTYDINGILIADVTVVSTGQTVSKVISQNMDEKELESKISELQKLRIHPKDTSENALIMEKLKALYEEVSMNQRIQVRKLIADFEMVLAGQDPRKIAKYRRFLEVVIMQLGNYDPFAREICFAEFEDEEETGEENGEVNGGDDIWNR